MNKITKLSPAAQAVHDAFWSHPNGKPLVQDCPDTDQLVAALRAAADQVVPHLEITPQQDLESTREAMMWGMENQTQVTRQQLLDIAAELDSL